jgi:hypothetical protein
VGEVGIEFGPEEAPLGVVALDGAFTAWLEESHYSPGYGELCPSRRAVWGAAQRLPARSGHVVLFFRT